MQVVRLRCSNDRIIETMPRVCVQCGLSSDLEIDKRFAWQPSWVFFVICAGWLPFLIVFFIFRKTRWVKLPVCEAHTQTLYFLDWLKFYIIIYTLCLPVFVFDCFGFKRMIDNDTVYFCALGAGVLLWVISIAYYFIVKSYSIHVTQIDDFSITLKNLSVQFGTELWNIRQEERRDREYDDD